jgi:hypothetical protein
LQEPLPGQPFDEFGERLGGWAVELTARSAHDADDDAAVDRSSELPIQALHGLGDRVVAVGTGGHE